VSMFQTLTVPVSSPIATRAPSGLNAKLHGGLPIESGEAIGSCESALQILTGVSPSPTSKYRPVKSKASAAQEPTPLIGLPRGASAAASHVWNWIAMPLPSALVAVAIR